MLLKVAGILFVFLFPIHSIGAIQVRCVEALGNGNANIAWINTSPVTNFTKYYIYRAAIATGPFMVIDSITNYGTQNYIDATVNINSGNAFYFIKATYLPNTIYYSDTVNSIRLNVINSGNGYATLIWNTTHTPVFTSNSPYYKIYYRQISGLWILHDSVDVRISTPNYADEISVCSDSLYYKIEVDDNSGCRSVSNTDGDFFEDVIPPSNPLIDSVSVDNNGMAVIGWSPNPSMDTYQYVVLQNTGSNIVALDTVTGRLNTFYATTVSALTSAQIFSLLAIDSCGNPSVMSSPQNTIRVSGVIDRCNASIQLSWNNYQSIHSVSYKILVSQNSSGYSQIGSTNSNTFEITGLKPDTTYCIKVRAQIGNTFFTSTSNEYCVTPDLPKAPLFCYIRKATVEQDNLVKVVAYVDSSADAMNYFLQRSESSNSGFQTVATISFLPSSYFEYLDETNTGQVNYYRIVVNDSCSNALFVSNTCRTSTLDVSAGEDYINTVEWHTYSGFLAGNGIQRLLKADYASNNAFYTLHTTTIDTIYFDNVIFAANDAGKFCYVIETVESTINQFGFQDTVRSNKSCAVQESVIFIPNAFRPDGVNHVFCPGTSFLKNDDYNLQIFNRFGELIFKSTDKHSGWDGTYQGHRCPSDLYVYLISYRLADQTRKTKKGTVFLVR